ncbi:hypothetical protein F2P81_020612 [Scophthalmus maximus]|uniref:Uncharacterized protein n=1 Tax=Scophthalmus maximus TaxID=52904 RepID=A0A6A4S9U2_SCOMX|nr:hypothetical protein F2P81_020612 [Scophthalmus maximus]
MLSYCISLRVGAEVARAIRRFVCELNERRRVFALTSLSALFLVTADGDGEGQRPSEGMEVTQRRVGKHAAALPRIDPDVFSSASNLINTPIHTVTHTVGCSLHSQRAAFTPHRFCFQTMRTYGHAEVIDYNVMMFQ